MSFEDEVARSVIENAGRHALWYVKDYAVEIEGETAEQRGQRQAGTRSEYIKGENSGQSVENSARLKIAEYLDCHPAAQKHIEQFVKEHEVSNGPKIGLPNSTPGPNPAEVLQEQLENLEGNFLGALAQGICNEIWPNDLDKSREMAAPFVNGSEMIMGFGEGMTQHAETINEIREPFEERLNARDEIGREDVAEALKGIGSDTPATQFPSAAEELGNNAAEAMAGALGWEKTEEILEARTPGEPLPGYGGYEAGNPPESESREDDKEKGADADGKETQAPSAASPDVNTPDYTASPDGNIIDYAAPDAAPMLDYVATPDASSQPIDYSPNPDAASTPDYHAAADPGSAPGHPATPDYSPMPDAVPDSNASLHPDAANTGIDGQANHPGIDAGQSGATLAEPNYQDATGAAFHVGIDGSQSPSTPNSNLHPDASQQISVEHNEPHPG